MKTALLTTTTTDLAASFNAARLNYLLNNPYPSIDPEDEPDPDPSQGCPLTAKLDPEPIDWTGLPKVVAKLDPDEDETPDGFPENAL